MSAPAPAGAAQEAAMARAEALLAHRFGDRALLAEALTHRSALGHRRAGRRGARVTSNERLEFVGDRVLGLLVAEWLLERFPGEPEGSLAMRLARLVSRPVLAGIAEAAGLAEAMVLAANEARSGVHRLSTVLADGMEAVLGALYLDGGLAPARAFVRAAWAEAMAADATPPKDPKTALQEKLAALGMKPPAYVVASATGPSHAPHFVVRVEAAGMTGTGEAGTKREAQRAAAADLLGRLA